MQYISLVDGDVLDTLREQLITIPDALSGITDADAGYRYAPNKWSIREVVGHMSDAERVYQFRALAFARNDAISLPRYDPDDYVTHSGSDRRSMRSLIEEILAVRESTLQLFENLEPAMWDRNGTVSGGIISVRATAFIAAGHAQRHMNVLRERYGVAVAQSDAVSIA
jgi:hypothetical protein